MAVPSLWITQRRMADDHWKKNKTAEAVSTDSHPPRPQSITGQKPVDRAIKEENVAQVDPSVRAKVKDSRASAETSNLTSVTIPTNEQAPNMIVVTTVENGNESVPRSDVILETRPGTSAEAIADRANESITSSNKASQVTLAETLQLLQSVGHRPPATQELILRRVFGADSSEPTSRSVEESEGRWKLERIEVTRR